MTLPGETEAGSAGMHPCRGILGGAHRDDVSGRGSSPFALFPTCIGSVDPLCLENPRPERAEYSLTENAPSPFHAEPEHVIIDDLHKAKLSYKGRAALKRGARTAVWQNCAFCGDLRKVGEPRASCLGH